MAYFETDWRCENENRKGRTKQFNKRWASAFVSYEPGEDGLKKSLRTSVAFTERTWAALKEASET
jgi:hypothetical protein